jgi:hypothetical protein
MHVDAFVVSAWITGDMSKIDAHTCAGIAIPGEGMFHRSKIRHGLAPLLSSTTATVTIVTTTPAAKPIPLATKTGCKQLGYVFGFGVFVGLDLESEIAFRSLPVVCGELIECLMDLTSCQACAIDGLRLGNKCAFKCDVLGAFSVGFSVNRVADRSGMFQSSSVL